MKYPLCKKFFQNIDTQVKLESVVLVPLMWRFLGQNEKTNIQYFTFKYLSKSAPICINITKRNLN